VVVGAQLIPKDADRWQPYGFSVDEATRDALRIRSQHGELYARDASDFFMLLAVGYPFLVDSLTVAWWHHGNQRVARETALISTETLAVTSAVQSVVSGFTSRQRPYGRRCGGDISEENLYCEQRNRYRSFFSGHTSVSFASAATLCVQHAHIPLYGGASDQLACGIGFVNAAAVGALRIASDQHYLSDVLVGAGVGTLTGLAVPWFLHYKPSESRGYPPAFTLRVLPAPGGLSVGGDF
jgi:membrane-associated phospholipid phosphatase